MHGAGRVVLQDLMRITTAFASRETPPRNPVLTGVMDQVARLGTALHVMGLTSDGGVHSHRPCTRPRADGAHRGVRRIVFHAFLDGRDTAPRALDYITALQRFFREEKAGSFGTVMGRYHAMDQDNRWERTELAWKR